MYNGDGGGIDGNWEVLETMAGSWGMVVVIKKCVRF